MNDILATVALVWFSIVASRRVVVIDAVAAVVRAAQIGDTQGDQGPWKKARGPGRGAEASRLDVDDTDTVSTP